MAKKPESPDSDSCASCVHWIEDKEPGGIGRFGECRRYPPAVLLNSEDEPVCLWPMTDDTHCCGEFKQRTQ